MHPSETRSLQDQFMIWQATEQLANPANELDQPPVGQIAHATLHEGLSLSQALRNGWDDLVANSAEPNPFVERWFIEASRHCKAQGEQVRIAAVEDHSGLIGIAPLCIRENYGRLQVDHVENWQHANMFLGTPLVRQGKEEVFWNGLIPALDDDKWARGFLHLDSMVEDGPVHHGLKQAARTLGRSCPVVHRELRPLLHSNLPPEDYLKRNVKSKRRSEFNRLRRRLGEQGLLKTSLLTDAAEIEPWGDAFLKLEKSGWKGEAGSALACYEDGQAFFREILSKAFAHDRLHFLRLDLDDRPIAMLTSLRASPGAFGFKSCFDQDFARFSPGILLQIDNLELLNHPDIEWQDSCAAPDHPVAALWSEKRAIIRITIPLKGVHRSLIYAGVRAVEKGSDGFRRLLSARG